MDPQYRPPSNAPQGTPDLADFGYVPNTQPMGPSLFSFRSGSQKGRRSFWPRTQDRKWWHYALTAPLFAVLFWFPFVRGVRVPILGSFDLAVHEFGHVLFLAFPHTITVLMGNGTQSLVPLLLAAGLAYFSKDRLGASLCLSWAGTTFQDASVYIADAPFRALPLVGGAGPENHDWGQLLGPQHFNMMNRAQALADLIWFIGLVIFMGGALFALYSGVVAWTSSRGAASQGKPVELMRFPTTTQSWTPTTTQTATRSVATVPIEPVRHDHLGIDPPADHHNPTPFGAPACCGCGGSGH